MRGTDVEIFENTLSQSFNTAIESMLGKQVKEQVLRLLERSGISYSQIGLRFDDAVIVLMDAFGEHSRLLIHKTVVELYNQYSVRINFNFNDSLHDQIINLKERVVADHLRPRHNGTDDYLYVVRTGMPQW